MSQMKWITLIGLILHVLWVRPVSAQSELEGSFSLYGLEQLSRLEQKTRALAARIETEAQESEKASIRWKHAKELLGKQYHKSVVKEGEGITNLDKILLDWVERGLKGAWKKK